MPTIHLKDNNKDKILKQKKDFLKQNVQLFVRLSLFKNLRFLRWQKLIMTQKNSLILCSIDNF